MTDTSHLPFSRRIVEASGAAAVSSALYFVAGNPVTSLRAPMTTWLDGAIPFVPEAVWLYLPGYWACFFLTAWAIREWRAFRGALVAFLAMSVVALPFFLLFPVDGPRPAAPHGATLTEAVVRWLYANDPSVNTFPSLHVANATLCAVLAWRHHRAAGAVVWSLTLGVYAAVLLVKQHWVIDLPGGWAVAAVGLAVWRLHVSGVPRIQERLAPAFVNAGRGSRSRAPDGRSPAEDPARSRPSGRASPGDG